ncbi:hypothetical protein ACFWZ2_15370 [Streptomyces sp. NPDC059002]|uniref:hypothetical protein n=1 Tax=Streptomyces sp. NPDC059002 TaxID=3346690 RepID=UPI00367B1BAC
MLHAVDHVRLAAHGAEVTWDENLPGHRRFYSRDPVGNRLEFLEPVAGESAGGRRPNSRPTSA